MSSIATVNPATEVTEKSFEPYDDRVIDAKLELSARAFSEFRRWSFADRADRMRAAADLLNGEITDIARVMTTEMGKTFAAAKAEVAKCAMAMSFFADHAERFLGDEVVEDPSPPPRRAIYRPMGPVLAVMPWNFPLWQVVRFAAPALMAGNVAVLKHASNVPQTALLIEDVFRRAGMPEGVFQTLLVGSEKVGKVVADPRVRAVTLTGSEAAGRSVAQCAGQALKKCVLELGGSDGFLVMPSCDLDKAVEVGVQARVQNNGQSCIAAKRFIVHSDVYDQFCESFVGAMAGLSIGDPMENATEVGPLALGQGRSTVHEQVTDAVGKGANLLCGGKVLSGPGFYYPPTAIASVKPGMRVYREEVFGPVAVLFRVEDVSSAIELCNDSPYGLGASVWTNDETERRIFVEDLQVGMVFFNSMVASRPELPFGGTKASGFGRELSFHGIREFCEIKSVSG